MPPIKGKSKGIMKMGRAGMKRMAQEIVAEGIAEPAGGLVKKALMGGCEGGNQYSSGLEKAMRRMNMDPSTHIASAFCCMMDQLDSVPRYAEAGFGTTQASAVYNVFMEVSTVVSFPQAGTSYPNNAGGFLSGVTVYQGATATPYELSVYQFRSENQRTILEDFNPTGAPVPYQWYDSDGSIDFNINVAQGAGGSLSIQAIQHDIAPCYAAFNANLVGGTANPSSIFKTGTFLALTGAFAAPAYAAHGVPASVGVIPFGRFDGRRWIWHDAGNAPGSTSQPSGATTSFNDLVTQRAADHTATATGTDSTVSGCICIAWGANAAVTRCAFTVELWAYNEKTPYRVGTYYFSSTADIPSASVGEVLMVMQIPYPDYHSLTITGLSLALQAGGGFVDSINLRIFQISASHLYRHLCNPAWDDVWTKVNAHRGFGSAVRIHNSTVGNFGGGDVADWQASLGAEWQAVIDGLNGATAFDFINQKNKQNQESIGLTAGAYSWLRPVQQSQAAYSEDVEKLYIAGPAGIPSGNGQVPVALGFDLANRSFHVTTVQVPKPSNSVPLQKLNYYMGYTGQWTTDGQYYELAEGDYTPAEWVRAMRKLQSMCTLTSNENHVERIQQIFRSVGRHNGDSFADLRPYAEMFIKHAPTALGLLRNLVV